MEKSVITLWIPVEWKEKLKALAEKRNVRLAPYLYDVLYRHLIEQGAFGEVATV